MNNYQMFRKIQERDNIIKKYSNDTKEDLIDLVIEKDNIIDNLQSKIDKANELLEEILVVSDWEHEGRFRPVKNTTAQDVYKAVCMLYGILETPYRSDYGALKEDK